jgi:Hemerythrin HHE cation binding domain
LRSTVWNVERADRRRVCGPRIAGTRVRLPSVVVVVEESDMRMLKRLFPIALIAGVIAVLGGFSRVRRQAQRAKRTEQHADPAFMYAMHAAFRRDLDRLVSQAHAPTEHTIDGWDVLRRQLESHHQAEDDDLWPVLRAHVDTPVVDDMEHEHAMVPPALDAVQRAIDDGESFDDQARELRRVVVEHLDHEERAALPLIATYLSDQEWHDWLVKERSKHQPKERVEFLSWVLDDADADSADTVLRELPPPGRVVYRRVLAPRYRRRHLWAA